MLSCTTASFFAILLRLLRLPYSVPHAQGSEFTTLEFQTSRDSQYYVVASCNKNPFPHFFCCIFSFQKCLQINDFLFNYYQNTKWSQQSRMNNTLHQAFYFGHNFFIFDILLPPRDNRITISQQATPFKKKYFVTENEPSIEFRFVPLLRSSDHVPRKQELQLSKS